MFRQGESLNVEQPRTDTPKVSINNLFADIGAKIKEAKGETKYYTTYEERFNHTPVDGKNGEWDGVRGESKFVPADKEVQKQLANYGIDGITYKNCEPRFGDIALASVGIDMSRHRDSGGYGETRIIGNYEKADTQCAKLWNTQAFEGKTDWAAITVRDWRREHQYTWHECCDMKTCLLIQGQLHSAFRHSGGCAECKIRDANEGIQQ